MIIFTKKIGRGGATGLGRGDLSIVHGGRAVLSRGAGGGGWEVLITLISLNFKYYTIYTIIKIL